MSKTLQFWVQCEYEDRRETSLEIDKSKLLAEILCEFESSGDAMRYLHRSGEIIWKATPRMLQRLADAESEVKAEMEEWP
jgi:hypothetical protein